jgi:hypothetical protein
MKIVFQDLVAVANAEGKFYTFGNICPHARGPIDEGSLRVVLSSVPSTPPSGTSELEKKR